MPVSRQHRHRRTRQVHLQIQLESEVTNWSHEGGADDQHPKKPKTKNEKRDGSRDADDRLRDLPKWLEEFTVNKEDTELPASTQFSDSERPTKVVSKSRTVLKLTSKKPKLRSLLADHN